MRKTYEVADRTDRRAIADFLKREGQFLLPMVELVDRAELAIDSVIEVMGRATIEAVLEMSAETIAGPKAGGPSSGSRRHRVVRSPGRRGVPVGSQGSHRATAAQA